MGTYVHGDKTRGEDNTLCILEFDGGAVGLVENSWARRGGMDDRVEILRRWRSDLRQPAYGQRPANLQRIWLRLRCREGPDHEGLDLIPSTRSSGTTVSRRRCTTSPAACAARRRPIATGEDGRIVQEVLLAGYRSARIGAKIGLPFRPTGIKRPIDLWLGAADVDLS